METIFKLTLRARIIKGFLVIIIWTSLFLALILHWKAPEYFLTYQGIFILLTIIISGAFVYMDNTRPVIVYDDSIYADGNIIPICEVIGIQVKSTTIKITYTYVTAITKRKKTRYTIIGRASLGKAEFERLKKYLSKRF